MPFRDSDIICLYGLTERAASVKHWLAENQFHSFQK